MDPRSLNGRAILTAVINFVRRIPDANNLDAVAETVFLSCYSVNEKDNYQVSIVNYLVLRVGLSLTSSAPLAPIRVRFLVRF